MLLRRIMEHTQAQNWTAIAIDFVIVVVGVFIGIQVSNWNEQLAFEQRETSLMRELHGEISKNLADVESKGDAFLIGAASARRVLEKTGRGVVACTNDCWSIVVDLLHASQWQQIMSSWSTYDELRRAGLPSDRQIIEMVEKYRSYNHQVALVLSVQPTYRTLVRGLIPIDLQDAYWETCYSLDDAVEVYYYPCAFPEGLEIDPAIIDEILGNPEIVRSLREWTSIARVVGTALTQPQKTLGHTILRRIGEGVEIPP